MNSIWTFRKFKLLESLQDRHRGAEYLSQIRDSDQMRPLGTFSNLAPVLGFLHPGWPQVHSGIRDDATVLFYVGALQKICPCAHGHKAMRVFLRTGLPITGTYRCGCHVVETVFSWDQNGRLPWGRRLSLADLFCQFQLPLLGTPCHQLYRHWTHSTKSGRTMVSLGEESAWGAKTQNHISDALWKDRSATSMVPAARCPVGHIRFPK